MKWYQRVGRYPEIWALTAVALFTRLWQIGRPRAIVFDEVHFRNFVSHYLDGQYFFDIHPPLVKLLLAGFAGLFGLTPEQVITGEDGALLRIIPALAGAALVPLVYVILRQFGLGRRIAALGGLLVLLDNSLLVESRFVLMDSFLLLFGLSMLSCYLMLRKTVGRQRWVWLIATAVCAGALVSTKWSGLAMVAVLVIAWLVEAVMHRVRWWHLVIEGMVGIGIVILVYVGSFAIHFTLLHHAGDGDAFMSTRFQSTLVGNANYTETSDTSFGAKFIELNKEMYTSQDSLMNVQHPYASEWHTWPLLTRPIYYWQSDIGEDGLQSHIYLLGNPIVWWGSAFSVIVAGLLSIFLPEVLCKRRRLILFLLLGYAANLLPFAFIDRPMFLYHYFFSLLFALFITCVLISLLLGWVGQRYGKQQVIRIYWGIVAIVLVTFLYFVPLSYGWPLALDDMQRYMWLPTWR